MASDRVMRAAHTAAMVVALASLNAIPAPADEASIARGEYVFRSAGCISCHTDSKNDGPLLGGGRKLETPFGTFYGPNITPHPERGIGAWSEEDFVQALRHGVSPDGRHYFPVFPYTSYTRMTDDDLSDLRAYIFSLPPVDHPSIPHDAKFPFGWRFLVGAWKWLNFEPGSYLPEPAQSAQWNRGAYLVRALAHCGECHSPRNAMGAVVESEFLAGTEDGPEGETTPNLTPHATGLAEWDEGDIIFMLQTGITPEGDVVGSLMSEVVEENTSKLSNEDVAAIAAYLKSLAPVDNPLKR